MPEAQLNSEPKRFEFGELVVTNSSPEEVNEINQKEDKINEKDEPIPEMEIKWYMTGEEVAEIQRKDPYCQRQLESLQNGKAKKENRFFMSKGASSQVCN